jgi:hypothetical protein
MPLLPPLLALAAPPPVVADVVHLPSSTMKDREADGPNQVDTANDVYIRPPPSVPNDRVAKTKRGGNLRDQRHLSKIIVIAIGASSIGTIDREYVHQYHPGVSTDACHSSRKYCNARGPPVIRKFVH